MTKFSDRRHGIFRSVTSVRIMYGGTGFAMSLVALTNGIASHRGSIGTPSLQCKERCTTTQPNTCFPQWLPSPWLYADSHSRDNRRTDPRWLTTVLRPHSQHANGLGSSCDGVQADQRLERGTSNISPAGDQIDLFPQPEQISAAPVESRRGWTHMTPAQSAALTARPGAITF
jgi:hypothetical protein